MSITAQRSQEAGLGQALTDNDAPPKYKFGWGLNSSNIKHWMPLFAGVCLPLGDAGDALPVPAARGPQGGDQL